MLVLLEGLPGKIKTLFDRLTPQRATNLDYLTSISSWTSATNNKFMNNTYYTQSLATQLNNLSTEGWKYQMYTAAGSCTFTVPSAVSLIYVTLVGAGGSGGSGPGGYPGYYNGGGGGGGMTIFNYPIAVTAGQTITGTVGTGGAVATSTTGGRDGTSGTNTTFSGIVAKAGIAGSRYSSGGQGGKLSYWDPTNYPTPKNYSHSVDFNECWSGAQGGNGACNYGDITYAGSGGMAGIMKGGASDTYSGGGGASWFGAGGGTNTYGAAYAGGIGAGGGGAVMQNSGAGGDGMILIEWITS